MLGHDDGDQRSGTKTRVIARGRENRWARTPLVPVSATGVVVQWGGKSMVNAAENLHVDLVRWMYENGVYDDDEEAMKEVIESIFKTGDAELARLLGSQEEEETETTPTTKAEVIEQMLNSGTLWLDDSRAAKAIEELAYEGRLDLMKRVAAVDPPPPLNKHSSWSWCWRRAVKIACKRGDLSMVQWLLEPPRAKEIRSAMRHDATDLVESAALEGHMEMLAFLYEHGFKDTWRDMSIVVKLIKKGQRKSVKWLLEHENYSKRWDPHRVIDAAALVGDLEMLKYFNGLFDSVEFDGTTRKRRRVARQLDSWWEDSSVMDIAAVYGHLDVVKWLHSNRPEGCSTRAMNEAAENGHLEVVQFLHANRQEGCTTRAMDGAVRNGHFDVVQWLYKNRSEGCTKEAVEVAAREGRLEILKWLHTHQFKGCSVETLEGAINHGCLKTVYWVHVHFPHLSPREGKLWPYLSHRFEVLLFLHEHFEHVMTPDFAQSTMRSIFDINNPVAEWMEERFPVVERREY